MLINLHCFYEGREKWIKKHSSLKNNMDLSRFLEDECDIYQIIKAICDDNIVVKAYDINVVDVCEVFDEIKKQQNCIIWNLTDGMTPFKGSNIPALAALFDIPHIGSNSYIQMLAQNKNHMRNVVSSMGVRVPQGVNIYISDTEFLIPFPPPYFIKPTCCDNSIGDKIAYPICQSMDEVYDKISKLRDEGIEQILVEEFLPGVEYSVALVNVGNWVAQCFKIEYDNMEYWDSTYKDKAIYTITPENTTYANNLINDSLLMANKLKINDYFRVDYRCNGNGEPCFLEINTTPFLICKSYTYIANTIFSSRAAMLNSMVRHSFIRQSRSLCNPEVKH